MTNLPSLDSYDLAGVTGDEAEMWGAEMIDARDDYRTARGYRMTEDSEDAS